MNAKLAGYILAGIGVFLIFIATPNIVKAIPLLKDLGAGIVKYIVIVGVIAVGVGIVLVMSQSSSSGKGKGIYSHKTKMGEEVPIFQDKEIVGYRIKPKKV